MTDQNRNPTGKGGFKPKQSGNPGGRKKQDPTVLDRLREETEDGWELYAQALKVLRCKPDESLSTMTTNGGEVIDIPATLKDKAEARQFIANRLWGLPKASVDVAHTGLVVRIDLGD